MYRRFYRELQFAREKSRKLMGKGDGFLSGLMQTALQEIDEGTQEENPTENQEEKRDCKKP